MTSDGWTTVFKTIARVFKLSCIGFLVVIAIIVSMKREKQAVQLAATESTQAPAQPIVRQPGVADAQLGARGMGPLTDYKPLPEVAVFLSNHPEFGTPMGTRAVSNWRWGKRQIVIFKDEKGYLFYEKNGSIMTVWSATFGTEGFTNRDVVWGDTKGAGDPDNATMDKLKASFTAGEPLEFEIYNALWQAGMAATASAEQEYPLGKLADIQIADGQEASKRHLEQHQASYRIHSAKNQALVGRKYKLSNARLEEIDSKGNERRWPVSETPVLFEIGMLDAPSSPVKPVQPVTEPKVTANLDGDAASQAERARTIERRKAKRAGKKRAN
jgi:hypothetical protein